MIVAVVMPDLKKKKKERKQRGSGGDSAERGFGGGRLGRETARGAGPHCEEQRPDSGPLQGAGCGVPWSGEGTRPRTLPSLSGRSERPGNSAEQGGHTPARPTFLSLCKGTVGITERSRAHTRTQGFSHIFRFGVNFSRETLCAPGNISGKRAGQGSSQRPGTSCYKCI